MTIGLVLDPYGEKEAGGLGRSIKALAEALIREGAEHRFLVYTKGGAPELVGGNWEHRSLGRWPLWRMPGSRFVPSDLMIFFTPVMPLFFRPKRSIVLVHDLAYLDMKRTGSIRHLIRRTLLYALHGWSLRRADLVACVSLYTKAQVIEHFKIPESRLVVVHNGFIPLGDREEEIQVPEPFFLFAGVLKRRKNVEGVIRAFASFAAQTDMPHTLAIAGKTEGAYYEAMVRVINTLGIASRVRFLGYVTDAQLRYLYMHAEALVFPSFIEGFGMPILEAMDLGCPVITSDSGALAEVAGTAALLVTPRDTEEIAAAMKQVAEDPALRTRLVADGRVRAATFSWKRAAHEYLRYAETLVHTRH